MLHIQRSKLPLEEELSLIEIEEKFKEYALKVDRDSNHWYDFTLGYRYEYHLQLTANFAWKYIHLVPSELRPAVIRGVWGHDLISDCRQTYNDILKQSCVQTAEICRGVTEDVRGRNRKERMPDYIYKEMASTTGAPFVKLCDRLANVTHGITVGGKVEMYKKEHNHFKKMLYSSSLELQDMWNHLEILFKTEA